MIFDKKFNQLNLSLRLQSSLIFLYIFLKKAKLANANWH